MTASTGLSLLRELILQGILMSEREDQPGFSLPIRVYYEDTDPTNVVYHANYLKFMERARIEWLRSLGFELDGLRRHEGLLLVVRRAEIDYLRPALFSDLLTVTVSIHGGGGASLDLAQEVRRMADATCCCQGRIRIACMDVQTMRPRRLPKKLLAEIADVR